VHDYVFDSIDAATAARMEDEIRSALDRWEPRIDVIGVATGTTPDRPNYPPSDWLEREKFPFPVMADSSDYDAANAYGLSAFPYFVVFDSSGKLVTRASGELDPTTLTTMLQTVT